MAHKRAIEEDPKAHQFTFDYVPPIWLGTLWSLMPYIQYPILYWSFHEGPNETVGSKGIAAFRHCADPA